MKVKDKSLYTDNSIETLDPLSFTRLRPQVYCGSTEYSTQLLVEIISNAVDEFRLSHCDTIKVNIQGDVVSVLDNGQGFLVNRPSQNDPSKTILEASFSVLNTSGKFHSDGVYEGTSLGSFGIGGKLSNFLSHWMLVATQRDGKTEIIRFKEGVFEKRDITHYLEVFPSQKTSGTYVQWKPSEEFFTHTEVEINKIKDLFWTIACLCPGLTIELNYNGKVFTYKSENGINDLIDQQVKETELINNRFVVNGQEGKNKIDFVLTYTTSYSANMIAYVNTGLTEKGPHITQIKTLITREFNKFFKEKGWIKDNLSGEDIQEGSCIVFNITAPDVAYDAQVKTNITRIDMTPFTAILTDNIQTWLERNQKELKFIADKALNAQKAREAARKARDNARKVSVKKEKALKFDSKLADCYSKDRKKCEIFVVEGK